MNPTLNFAICICWFYMFLHRFIFPFDGLYDIFYSQTWVCYNDGSNIWLLSTCKNLVNSICVTLSILHFIELWLHLIFFILGSLLLNRPRLVALNHHSTKTIINPNRLNIGNRTIVSLEMLICLLMLII